MARIYTEPKPKTKRGTKVNRNFNSLVWAVPVLAQGTVGDSDGDVDGPGGDADADDGTP